MNIHNTCKTNVNKVLNVIFSDFLYTPDWSPKENNGKHSLFSCLLEQVCPLFFHSQSDGERQQDAM